jgi:hypothetical protein
MALAQPVRQGIDSAVDIRLRDRVVQIWRKVLALRYHPCEYVSERCLR